MKYTAFLFALLLCCTLCLGVFAVTDDATLYWADADATPSPTPSGINGYPRFAQRADGTLLMTVDNGYIAYSTDKGATWAKSSQKLTANAAAEKTTATKTHSLTRANFQPFVLPDGTVLLAYRSHTKSYAATDSNGNANEFYTSIRVMTSTDGGMTFDNEKILVEDVALREDGFWEPFMIMLDDDTVAMYYADDLNVVAPSAHAKQRIAFLTYTISTDTWSTEPQVAINRNPMTTRDGMPTITALKDGGFAMVVEAQDYASWRNIGTNCTFVIGLSLSKDGKTWSDPVPTVAPADLTAGILCAAPSIATLPDGRVVITCATDSTYSGYQVESATYRRCMAVAISNAPLTADTELTATTGGAAPGFTMLEDVFPTIENRCLIWNTVSCFGNDVYFAGTSSLNAEDGTRSNHLIRVRRATAFATQSDADAYHAMETRAEGKAVSIQPMEAGAVSIPVPTVLKASSVYVYCMEGAFLTPVEATLADGIIAFTAEKDALYAIANDELVTYGDANGDEKISLIDIIRVLKHLVNNSIEIDIAAADFVHDNVIDIQDVLQSLFFLLS